MNERKHAPEKKSQRQYDRKESGQVYYYEAAGISENHGYVPKWLWGVVIVMAIWGVYYLYAYWAPAG